MSLQLGPLGQISRVELADQIPDLLSELEAVMRRGQGLPAAPTNLPESSSTAEEHGLQRLRLGFDINANA